MNKEYIERGALLEKSRKVCEYDEAGFHINYKAVPVDEIQQAPAADVVEVVRCKDCHQSCYVNGAFGETLFCTYWNKDTDEDGYCHEGG